MEITGFDFPILPTTYDADSEMVTILVGPEEQEFELHRDLLSKRSLFFAKALKTDAWKEGASNTLKLPEHIPMIFSLWADTAYDQNYGLTCLTKLKNFEVIAEVLVLSEYLVDPSTKALMTFLILKFLEEQKRWFYPPGAAVNIIYGGTYFKDPIRKLMQDSYVAELPLNARLGTNSKFLRPKMERAYKKLCGVHFHPRRGKIPDDDAELDEQFLIDYCRLFSSNFRKYARNQIAWYDEEDRQPLNLWDKTNYLDKEGKKAVAAYETFQAELKKAKRGRRGRVAEMVAKWEARSGADEGADEGSDASE